MARFDLPILAVAIASAVPCTADPAVAQSIPRTSDFSGRLPDIPLTVPVTPVDVLRQALPGSGKGITIAPGVVVDRLVRPRCVFIANQNQGGSSVRQNAEIGRVQLYCP